MNHAVYLVAGISINDKSLNKKQDLIKKMFGLVTTKRLLFKDKLNFEALFLTPFCE